MLALQTPGVHRAERPASEPVALRTGVPAFLGLATDGDLEVAQRLQTWAQFGERFGGAPEGGFLAAAVQGFFANGGEVCHVVRVDEAQEPVAALRRGLERIEDLGELDLVALPDACRLRAPHEMPASAPDRGRVRTLQRAVIEHCERAGSRIAILDSLPAAGQGDVLEQRRELTSDHATLYHPWLLVADGEGRQARAVPPCGHVAGVYAATDRRTGVHKAPANEALRDVLDLERDISDALQAELNPAGVNCLRAFPGRGIRVWGARTLSADPAWSYVNMRRLLLTLARWIEANLAGGPFEPSAPSLWGRIRRELSAHLDELYERGALKGTSAAEAFFVRCDADTNAGSEPGHVVVEIGLAAALPNEFVVVHVIHEPGGVSVVGPNRST